ILAHMMYQLLMCVLQTAITLFVMNMMGMKFQGSGLFTPWLVVDAGITMLLITYASDLLSLWISTLVHSTTTAMTIMPFVLIFQLIFSGGLFALPQIVDPIVKLTISSPGLKAMASQTQVNSLPYDTVTDMLNLVDDVEFGGRITVGQVLDALGDSENQTISELRQVQIGNVMTVREVGEAILTEDNYKAIRETNIIEGLNVGQVISLLMDLEPLEDVLSTNVGFITTLGDVVDFLATNETVQSFRDEGLTIRTTLGDILDLVGREETKALVESKAAEALYEPDYAYTQENIINNWLHLLIFIAAFALLSTITLEFIDKDKR
ncbi:MAG: hypothetical protein IIY55_04915, partial [Blautia sp.]|nr:hypothetical protein [Blautia sp.]